MSVDIYQLNRVHQPIVAGLLDEHSIEFFAIGQDYHALFQGKLVQVAELPERILSAIERDMAKNHEARQALNQLQLTDRIDRITQYLWCRYGGFDHEPDMVNEQMGTPEYWPCPLRGSCPHEFKLCAPIAGPEGQLSAAEIKVVKALANNPNMADKQLADHLGLKRFTIMVHLSNIRQKMGFNSRAAIVAMALAKGIV
jgi:DNA-binding CsgD family transcriptional regulator